jgi:hypothetical protein
MIELIKKGAKLSEENRTLLWIEATLFSIMAGLVCHSWIAFILVASVLIGLMTRPNGMFYMIFAISALWAFLPFCWGFATAGWIGAFIVGGTVFWMAIKVHVNGLKWHWDEMIYKDDDTIEWKHMTWAGPHARRPLLGQYPPHLP